MKANQILTRLAFAAALATSVAACTTPAVDANAVQRTLVSKGDVRIETLAQGQGPVIVILPSLARGAEDYDEVARLLARDGFRVLRRSREASAAARGRWPVSTCMRLHRTSRSCLIASIRGPS